MFKIGDRVKQLDTGNIGIVVGYGHRIVNNKCLKTIKVKLDRSTSIKETIIIEPDSKWLLCQADSKTIHSDSPARHTIEKPVKKHILLKQNSRALIQ